MDILFENSFARDKQMAKEVYSYYFFKSRTYLVTDILVVILFIFNLAMALIYKQINVLGFIIAPMFFGLQTLMYLQTVKALLRRDKELYGDEGVTIRSQTTDSSIKYFTSSGDESELDYSNVKYAAQTKGYILLFSKAGLIYIFKKDGFINESPENFISFLSSKNIQMK